MIARSRNKKMAGSRAEVMILCVASFYLYSCASSGPLIMGDSAGSTFEAAPDQDKARALLYLYRPWAFKASLVAPLIYINNEKIIILQNRGYTWLSLEPGRYMIETQYTSTWVRGRRESYAFIAENGRTYFIRLLPELIFFGPFISGADFHLTPVQESGALNELRETRYIEPDKKQLP